MQIQPIHILSVIYKLKYIETRAILCELLFVEQRQFIPAPKWKNMTTWQLHGFIKVTRTRVWRRFKICNNSFSKTHFINFLKLFYDVLCSKRGENWTVLASGEDPRAFTDILDPQVIPKWSFSTRRQDITVQNSQKNWLRSENTEQTLLIFWLMHSSLLFVQMLKVKLLTKHRTNWCLIGCQWVLKYSDTCTRSISWSFFLVSS